MEKILLSLQMQELQQFLIHGEEVVKEAIVNGIKIIPIPGACALINALIASGLDTKEFSFYAFLPLNKKLRKNKFEEIEKEEKTIIIYEAPHKLISTLEDILKNLGNRKIVIAKELTKIHETFIRGTVEEILQKLDKNTVKGEYIILIEGNEIKKENELNFLPLDEHYRRQIGSKMRMVSYYDKSIIIMKIVNDNGAIMFDNGYYTRVGANNDPEPVSAPEMPAFFAKFAKN